MYTERFRYTGDPPTVDRDIVLPSGRVEVSAKFRLDAAGRVVEMWGDEGYHVRWKYDTQGRAAQQSTDPYNKACDSCPFVGTIETRYEGSVREQIFVGPGGRPLLRRVSQMERDGSAASIAYEWMPAARSDETSELYRKLEAVVPNASKRYVETKSDDHDNWIEKREYFQLSGGPPILQAVFRRRIVYR